MLIVYMLGYFHKEILSVLIFVLPICLILFLIPRFFKTKSYIGFLLKFLGIFLLTFTFYFFRNPERKINTSMIGILSPADGEILSIKEGVFENEYFKDNRIQISIFMSPLNVHVNRAPITGVLKYYKYHPGDYLVAFHEKSSTLNERNTIVLQRDDDLMIMFRQIAGFLAKRIVFYPKVGDRLEQGQEVGMIRLGSRVDVFLPMNANIAVKVGDQVTAGQSLLADVKKM